MKMFNVLKCYNSYLIFNFAINFASFKNCLQAFVAKNKKAKNILNIKYFNLFSFFQFKNSHFRV